LIRETKEKEEVLGEEKKEIEMNQSADENGSMKMVFVFFKRIFVFVVSFCTEATSVTLLIPGLLSCVFDHFPKSTFDSLPISLSLFLSFDVGSSAKPIRSFFLITNKDKER